METQRVTVSLPEELAAEVRAHVERDATGASSMSGFLRRAVQNALLEEPAPPAGS